jgi:hypothetical protein
MTRINRPTLFLIGEFAVLVIGVFMGVQVDRWYEDRKQDEAERNYLIRLQEDVVEMTEMYDSSLLDFQQLYEEAVAAGAALETCQPGDGQRSSLDAVFSSHQVMYSLPVSRSTYDEMIASGAFASIKNPRLKKQTANLYTLIDMDQNVLGYLRQDLGRASAILMQRISFSNDPEGQLMVADYDIETICQVPQIRSALAEVIDSRADWLISGKMIRERLTEVFQLLEEELAST